MATAPKGASWATGEAVLDVRAELEGGGGIPRTSAIRSEHKNIMTWLCNYAIT